MNTNPAHKLKSLKTSRVLAAVLGTALIAGTGSYARCKPAHASAASVAPAAAALDEASVAPLLTLDRAMETLAGHVTPAVVNVTVTANHKEAAARGGDDNNDNDDDMQRFF